MRKSPYTGVSSRSTSPNEPILGENMVENNTGGFVFKLDEFKTMERFLVLGSEGGSYYTGEQKLTKDAAANTIEAIEKDGKRAVDLIVAVSDGGRALKTDPAIFALAIAASAGSPTTRAYALAQLHRVCRIPTHLFHFLTFVEQFRGWGRGLKRAVASWYNEQDVEKLAYQMVKYQQRDGWSNADALRLSHPQTSDAIRNSLYKWAVDGWDALLKAAEENQRFVHPPFIVGAFEGAKGASLEYVIDKIKSHNLSREMIPTEHLKDPKVWEALLYAGNGMPITAMIRNLGNMSKAGLLAPLSSASKYVRERLTDQVLLQKGRVHPITLLLASRTYEQGHGVKSDATWEVEPRVVEALDEAFYLAFKSIQPTGKRFLFGVDVSGSMTWGNCAGALITPAEAAAALALACAKVETEYHIMGFSDTFKDLGITTRMSLKEILKKTANMTFGSTDCSLPMEWALKNKVGVDTFVVITDNELNSGRRHPKQALRAYREQYNPRARQVVMGMTATSFTIADPKDPLTLDIAGMDASVPQVLQEFSKL